jgi:hypothetical protein
MKDYVINNFTRLVNFKTISILSIGFEKEYFYRL